MWRDDSKPGPKGDIFVEVFHVRCHQPIRLRLDGRDQRRYVVAMTCQVAMVLELLFGDFVEPYDRLRETGNHRLHEPPEAQSVQPQMISHPSVPLLSVIV